MECNIFTGMAFDQKFRQISLDTWCHENEKNARALAIVWCFRLNFSEIFILPWQAIFKPFQNDWGPSCCVAFHNPKVWKLDFAQGRIQDFWNGGCNLWKRAQMAGAQPSIASAEGANLRANSANMHFPVILGIRFHVFLVAKKAFFWGKFGFCAMNECLFWRKYLVLCNERVLFLGKILVLCNERVPFLEKIFGCAMNECLFWGKFWFCAMNECLFRCF
jgi:hypothetical protein